MAVEELEFESTRLIRLILERIEELKALDFPTLVPKDFLQMQQQLFELLKKNFSCQRRSRIEAALRLAPPLVRHSQFY